MRYMCKCAVLVMYVGAGNNKGVFAKQHRSKLKLGDHTISHQTCLTAADKKRTKQLNCLHVRR